MNYSSTQLPQGYIERASLDLSKDRKLLISLQLLGMLSLVVTAWLFWVIMFRLQPQAGLAFGIIERPAEGSFTINFTFPVIIGLLVSMVLMIVIHEAVHGFFFWFFTRRRPRFGFKGFYAYAASPPGVYLKRGPYLIVGGAPLVILTIVGFLLLPVVPLWALPTLYFFLVGNASGSIGDIMVIGWLLRLPSSTLLEDHGDAMTAYAPASL